MHLRQKWKEVFIDSKIQLSQTMQGLLGVLGTRESRCFPLQSCAKVFDGQRMEILEKQGPKKVRKDS